MPEELELKLEPAKAFDEVFIRQQVCRALRIDNDQLTAFRILKRSIDARKSPVYLLRIEAYLNGETMEALPRGFNLSEEKLLKRRVAVIGFGPAGIFAAMQLIENGYWPLVIERGKTVKDRRRDLAVINKELVVNSESNYCFGEGGAGTYSDGKLYTRSKKRGNVLKVLQTFVDHGANPDILINAHPHIAAALCERNIQTYVLGARTPLEALSTMVTRCAPPAIFLWAQLPKNAESKYWQDIPSIRPAPRIVVGGAGWDSISCDDVVRAEGLEHACEEIAQALGA